MKNMKTDKVCCLLVRDGDINAPTTTKSEFSYRDIFALADALRTMHDDENVTYLVLEPVVCEQLSIF